MILFGIVLLASMLSYLIPAGQFERVYDERTEQTVVVPGSYTKTESNPVSAYEILHKFFEAVTNTKNASLMFFYFANRWRL
jgi:uncharacterized ion transporter superfamily protein YfcC